ncbi:hypothetical protein RQM65_10620 [Pricia sp. S334]|uniref:Uncharacterized protein n=1 Tax=Pricia mediterranea TaxID=3076079 RepID=A0ABU3L7C1_9FLAO|nr:hypothetical protein [Pricia sp. S334]MDT7829118.1 hypothetical protein [Pricia sp. S334]
MKITQKILWLTLVILPWIVRGQPELNSDAGESFTWNWSLYAFCLMGCILQEVIYWYELRHDIAKSDLPIKLFSKTYWTITIIAVLFFSIASYFYFAEYAGLTFQNLTKEFFTVIVFSAGFPRLFKSAVTAVKSPRLATRAVRQTPKKFTWRTYFMVNDN